MENNLLIAEFMGLECWAPYANGRETYFNSFRKTKSDCENLILGSQFLYGKYEADLIPMHYHENWDWLMSVIEKISSVTLNYINVDNTVSEETYNPYPRTFGMRSEDGLFMFRFNVGQLFISDKLIDCAYEAVIDFIKTHKP